MKYVPEHFRPNEPKPKKRSHAFGVFLILIFLLIIAFGVYVWKMEWKFLEKYEEHHISHAADALMEKYKANDVDAILNEKSPEYDRFNDRDDYLRYMEDTFGSDYTAAERVKGRTDKDGSVHYDVYLGNVKFASYTLSPDGNHDKFWNGGPIDLLPDNIRSMLAREDWVMSADNLNDQLFVKTYGFKVCVPKGAAVFADGISIGSDMLSDETYVIHDYDDLDDKSLIPQFEIFEAENIFLNEPVITVKAADGTDMQLTEKNGMLTALPVPSDALLAEVEEFSQKASLAYAMYITQDAPFSDAEIYIVKDSEFMRKVKNFWHDWYRSHTVSHDEFVFSDIVMYDEEHIKLNISFGYHVNIGYKVNDYDVEYTLMLIKLDGEWKIASMIMY